jgi:PmbA protein
MTHTPLNVKELRDQLHTLATRDGIRRWDLGASRGMNASVQVDRGEAKQMKAAQRSSITVRVWNEQGLVGVTSTSDLSPVPLATQKTSQAFHPWQRHRFQSLIGR